MTPSPIPVYACPECGRKVASYSIYPERSFYSSQHSDSRWHFPPWLRFGLFHECLACGHFFFLNEAKQAGDINPWQAEDTDHLKKNYFTYKRAIDSRLNTSADIRYYLLLQTWWSFNELVDYMRDESLDLNSGGDPPSKTSYKPLASCKEVPPHELHRHWLAANLNSLSQVEKNQKQKDFYESYALPNLVYSLERFLFYEWTDINIDNHEAKTNWSRQVLQKHWKEESEFINQTLEELSLSIVEETTPEDFLLKADQLRSLGRFDEAIAKLEELKLKNVHLINMRQQLKKMARKKEVGGFKIEMEMSAWRRFLVRVREVFGV